jgi:undecaprenyl-diphosphatase
MTILQSIILGIIQGLTEFIPVSSSAHLVLAPALFGWNIPEEQVFVFDVLVQMGTLVAVILYFWRDLVSIFRAFWTGLVNRKPFETYYSRLGWYLILATIPAGIAGVFLKDFVEGVFNSPSATAILLFITALLLLAAEYFGRRMRPIETMTWKDALWIGASQILALFPGISRSGATITGGMVRNFSRQAAARFSFLMSIPIMLAAGLLEMKDLFESPELSTFLPIVLVGFVTAAVVGYFSINWLLSFLGKRSLTSFAIYCALVGAFSLIILYVR